MAIRSAVRLKSVSICREMAYPIALHKGGHNTDIGDISNPDLIDVCHLQVFDQVRIDGIWVIAVRGFDVSPGFLGKKTSLPHDTFDFLMVYDNAVPVELFRYLPVAVRNKVLGDLFDPVDNGLVLRRQLPGLRSVVVTASREVHEFAPPRDGFDKVSVVGNELSFFRDRSKF